MPEAPFCPNCGETDSWPVLVSTSMGVRMPGDSDAAVDSRTNREMSVCATCGTCYDPVIVEENA